MIEEAQMRRKAAPSAAVEFPPKLSRARSPEAPSWQEQFEIVEHWIGEHPTVCVGIALLAGVSLGWLIKRT